MDAAAARLLLKETGLELSQLLDIGAKRIGSVYQKWSRADVQVYQVPDIPGGFQWRDPDDLVRAGKARVFRDGSALTFRLDRNLALSAMLMARCHPGRGLPQPTFPRMFRLSPRRRQARGSRGRREPPVLFDARRRNAQKIMHTTKCWIAPPCTPPPRCATVPARPPPLPQHYRYR